MEKRFTVRSYTSGESVLPGLVARGVGVRSKWKLGNNTITRSWIWSFDLSIKVPTFVHFSNMRAKNSEIFITKLEKRTPASISFSVQAWAFGRLLIPTETSRSIIKVGRWEKLINWTTSNELNTELAKSCNEELNDIESIRTSSRSHY